MINIVPEYKAKPGDIVDVREYLGPDGNIEVLVVPDENEDNCLQAAIDSVAHVVAYAKAWWEDDSLRDRVAVRGERVCSLQE